MPNYPRLFSLHFVAVLLCASVTHTATLEEYIARVPFKMQVPSTPKFSERVFPITDYGAVGDGQRLNTLAIAEAIEACSKAGGGHVVIPAGLWLTGPIELRSGVDIHTERGALIQFTS